MKAILESHTHQKFPRLKIQLRIRSRFYQGLVFLDGRKHLKSLKVSQLSTAMRLGEEWYRKLLRDSLQERKRHPLDKLAKDPTVGDVFASYRSTLTPSKRDYADMKWSTIQHFWRTLVITNITAQSFRDFYQWRRRMKTRQGTRVKNHTLHKDVMVVRQILKFAIEEEQLSQLPPIPKVGRIEANPRPWLTREEYRRLIETSEERFVAAADANQDRVLRQRVDLHEFVQFMVLTMCRVNEALSLCYRDCRVDTKKMLVAEVTGKRGTRTIVAPRQAAQIIKTRYKRLEEKGIADPTALVFPEKHRDAFRELLSAADLLKDSHGHQRNFKSLRATAISFRLLEAKRPDLLMVARNAGVSANLIDLYYAKKLSAEMHADELSADLTGLEDLF